MSKEDYGFDLEDRLIDFAVQIIHLAGTLPKTKIGRHLSDQIIRSGTSSAPNYGEAQSAESLADFIHKMKICLKELRETKIWMVMILRANIVASTLKIKSLIKENDELISIFVASIKTARKNIKKNS